MCVCTCVGGNFNYQLYVRPVVSHSVRETGRINSQSDINSWCQTGVSATHRLAENVWLKSRCWITCEFKGCVVWIQSSKMWRCQRENENLSWGMHIYSLITDTSKQIPVGNKLEISSLYSVIVYIDSDTHSCDKALGLTIRSWDLVTLAVFNLDLSFFSALKKEKICKKRHKISHHIKHMSLQFLTEHHCEMTCHHHRMRRVNELHENVQR